MDREDETMSDATSGSQSAPHDAAAAADADALARSQDLKKKLSDAILHARLRQGRMGEVERRAATIMAYGMWAAARRLRRSGVMDEARFEFVQKNTTAVPSGVDPLVSAFGAELAAAARVEPPPPGGPPQPEEEAQGLEGRAPQPLARAMEQWELAKAGGPFVAGRVATVRLRWREGKRLPAPEEGKVWSWGPWLSTKEWKQEDKDVLVKLLGKDIRSGAVSVGDWASIRAVCPVSVTRHPVTGKPRLVDDRRAVNARLVPSSAKMGRITEALARGFRWMAKLDLAQAFRHLKVAEEDAMYLGFVINGVPFRWEALPFGCSQSPELFINALDSCIRETRREVAMVVYMDDILILAHSHDQLDAAAARLMSTLRGGGWAVALDKAFLFAFTKIPFLGLVVDLESQCVRVSAAKATTLRGRVEAVLRKGKASAKELQKIAGLLGFFALAVPECALRRRHIDLAAAEAERLRGETVTVRGEAKEELQFWMRTALKLPAFPPVPVVADGAEAIVMVSDASGMPTLGWGGLVWPANAPAPDIDDLLGAATSFETQARCHMVETSFVARGPFAARCAGMSSAALEVLSGLRVLSAFVATRGPEALRGRKVMWYCDATSAVAAVRSWRARAVGLTAAVNQLLLFVRTHGCSLHPHWVARDLGWQPAADYLSKLRWQRGTAEWALPGPVVRGLIERAGWTPDVDLFAASESNSQCAGFATRFPYKGAWCDAFSFPWSGMRLFAFPPFAVVDHTVACLARSKGTRMLLVAPADVRVPPHVRVSFRVPVTAKLVDAEGRQAVSDCPRSLIALALETPDGRT